MPYIVICLNRSPGTLRSFGRTPAGLPMAGLRGRAVAGCAVAPFCLCGFSAEAERLRRPPYPLRANANRRSINRLFACNTDENFGCATEQPTAAPPSRINRSAYHSGANADPDTNPTTGDFFNDLAIARTPVQLRCPSNADLEDVPAGGFMVLASASSGNCAASMSASANVVVYDDDDDAATAGLDGWSSADWDFGSTTDLPSVIGTDGVLLPGQPITP